MSKLYDILRKIKEEKPETELNKQPLRIKQSFKIKPMVLVLGFLGLVLISGIGLIFFSYYLKSNLPLNKAKIYSSNSSNNMISWIPQNHTSTLPQETKLPSLSTAKHLQKQPLSSSLVRKSDKKENNKKIFVPYSSTSYESFFSPKSEKEKPLEGFLLTQEDLLNNLLFIAEEERKKGNYKKAIFYYKNYLKEKKDPWVMNNLGACLMEVGDLEEAIKFFHQALSLNKDPMIHYNLIVAYLKNGDNIKACVEMKKIENNPDLHQQIAPLKEFCQN